MKYKKDRENLNSDLQESKFDEIKLSGEKLNLNLTNYMKSIQSDEQISIKQDMTELWYQSERYRQIVGSFKKTIKDAATVQFFCRNF